MIVIATRLSSHIRPLVLCAALLASMFVSSLGTQCLATEPPKIIGNQQVSVNGEIDLSISNYHFGSEYVWEIQSGDGTLSAYTGEHVTYRAPADNPWGANNPSIVVTTNGVSSEPFEIAVNAWTGNQVAYKDVGHWQASALCDGTIHMCAGGNECVAYTLHIKKYRCDGSELTAEESCYECPGGCGLMQPEQCLEHTYEDGNGCDMECCWYGCPGREWCPPTPRHHEECTDCIVDNRTDTMKQGGCYSEPLLPSYEPELVPEETLYGQKPLDGRPVCSVDRVSDPISVSTGNHTESAEDLRFATPFRKGLFIKRFYNSRQSGKPPVGYSWIHNYHMGLNPSVEFEDNTYLRIVDGTYRFVYFQDAGGGLFEGAFGEPTTVETSGGEYVWHHLDGSQYVFTYQSGGYRITRIEDEVGNRQTMTYHGSGSLIGRLETVTDEASDRVLTFHYRPDTLLDYITGPVTATVPGGVWVTYGYDANQNLTSVTYPDGSGFDYVYDDPNDVHNLTEKHDNAGHLIASWSYDSQDRAVSSYTRDGEGVIINYVSENEVEVTDAYGVTRTYSIWKLNGINEVTDVEGASECPSCGQEIKRLEYDSARNIIELEYVNGLINQYDNYDSRGNAGIERQAVGTVDERTITYTYHPSLPAKLSRTESSVLGGGNKVTIWDYDSDGDSTPNESESITGLVHRLIEQGYTKDASGNTVNYEYITAYTYNGAGQVLSIDGPRPGDQDKVLFTYYVSGDLETVTRPLAGTVTYTQYDPAGRPGQMTDENGKEFVFTYDGRGRVTTITNPDSNVITVDYDLAGEVSYTIAANGVRHNFTYDGSDGLLTQVTDPFTENYLLYNYDGQGNRIEASRHNAAQERKYWIRYDHHGQTHPGKLWKIINPDDTYTELTYDDGGNMASVTDPWAKTTSYAYDVLNRLTSVTQPGSIVTGYDYDAQGNLATVTDAEGHPTSYIYDDMGRAVSVTSTDTNTATYVHDAAGNLIWKTDANGATLTYEYDALNRLTAVRFPDAGDDIVYTYDSTQVENGKGRLTGMVDPSGTYVYHYNELGNLIREEKTVSGVLYTTEYDYDAAGTLTGMTYPDGRTVTYGLDAAGRVDEVTTTKNSVTTTLAEDITYLPFGPANAMTLGNGQSVSRSFDQRYLMTGATVGSTYDATYTVSSTGHVTEISDNADPNRDQEFGYDDLYRLTSAAGIYGSLSYTYDDVGNRLTEVSGAGTDTYTYEAGANLLAGITGPSAKTFSHDPSGNLTAVTGLASPPQSQVLLGQYTYNAHGQRIKATAGGATTVYHYDLSGNLIGETDASGNLIAQYVYLGDNRLAMISGAGAVYYYANDHLGTPQKMMDSSANVVWSADFEPFGEANVTVGTVGNDFRFAGQMFDTETGNHYNWHRYYNPNTGRYLTPDPIGLMGGINLYPYVQNDPIVFADPYGLWRGYSGLKGLGLLYSELYGGGIWAVSQMGLHDSTIKAAASKHGVDPILLNAIIYEEQSHLFPPIVEDKVGGDTIGIGQISSKVWREFGEGCPENRTDARRNIDAMARYLSFLQSKYGDDISQIAAHYNYYEPGRPTPKASSDYGERVRLYHDIFTFFGLGVLPGTARRRRRIAFLCLLSGLAALPVFAQSCDTVDLKERLPARIERSSIIYAQVEAYLPDLFYRKYGLQFVRENTIITETRSNAVDQGVVRYFYLQQGLGLASENERAILRDARAVTFVKYKGQDGELYLFTATGGKLGSANYDILDVRLYRQQNQDYVPAFTHEEKYSVDPGIDSSFFMERFKLFLYKSFLGDERYSELSSGVGPPGEVNITVSTGKSGDSHRPGGASHILYI